METSNSSLHILMYPWFAFGHITPSLQVSNKLAQKGHKISFFIPAKTQPKIDHSNDFSDLITFVTITVPNIDSLPPGAETTHDVPRPLFPLIMTAMDITESDVELLLQDLKADFVFFDFVHWIPKLARCLGIESLSHFTCSPLIISHSLTPARIRQLSEANIMQPAPGFPESSIKLYLHEARAWFKLKNMKFGRDVPFQDRLLMSLSECDALGFRTCREIDGPFIDYLETQSRKPLLLSGPLISD